ncbi:MAG: YqaJ viral recombinase family protein [Erythrobacter sp.]|nr:YqaJ viral recombinase family protein [Erythrobacter sp.]
MTIKIHEDLTQGSEEWHQARCGLLTCSEVKLILTPTLKVANNEKTRAHVWELAAQRITNYVEPSYIGDAMLRGHEDEIRARLLYEEKYAPVQEAGFVTNDGFGFTIGCSPDGLVGDDGMIECKSRVQKYQVQTIVEEFRQTGTIPEEFVLQVQSSLLVTGRKWCDFLSYSGGLPMVRIRVEADPEIQDAILTAATGFEERVCEAIEDYRRAVFVREYPPTERVVEEEMFV